MTETIVVGVDGTERSLRAVKYAISQAKCNNGRLVLGYVIEWSPFTFNTPEENEQRHKRREEEIQTAQQRVLDPMLASLETEGIDTVGVVRHGQVADVLIQIAKEHGANQIVVGRVGEKTLSTLIFGSVVAKLIQLTRIPVTIVP